MVSVTTLPPICSDQNSFGIEIVATTLPELSTTVPSDLVVKVVSPSFTVNLLYVGKSKIGSTTSPSNTTTPFALVGNCGRVTSKIQGTSSP